VPARKTLSVVGSAVQYLGRVCVCVSKDTRCYHVYHQNFKTRRRKAITRSWLAKITAGWIQLSQRFTVSVGHVTSLELCQGESELICHAFLTITSATKMSSGYRQAARGFSCCEFHGDWISDTTPGDEFRSTKRTGTWSPGVSSVLRTGLNSIPGWTSILKFWTIWKQTYRVPHLMLGQEIWTTIIRLTAIL